MSLLLALGISVLFDTHPWSGWKEGTTVTLRTTAVSGKTKVVKEEKFTVTKVEGQTVLLKVEVDDNGTKSSTDQTVVAVETPVKFTGTEIGKQDLTVDGVKLACTILEEEGFYGVSKFSGSKIKTKRWVCKGAPTPGGLVKEESASVQASVAARSSSFKLSRLKESVKIKGQAFTCWVVETTATEENQKTTARSWFSKEMPGWNVKSEKKVDTGGSITTITTEIVAVDIKK